MAGERNLHKVRHGRTLFDVRSANAKCSPKIGQDVEQNARWRSNLFAKTRPPMRGEVEYSKSLSAILDEYHARIVSDMQGDLNGAVFDLSLDLNEYIKKFVSDENYGIFLDACRKHPLREIVTRDPYTKRALDKPKGYAGDATMLDYIYRPQKIRGDGLGRAIHQATTNSPNALSIRYRQEYLSKMIDEAAGAKSGARILSVASGHMRELDRCRPESHRATAFYALDQDDDSLNEALKCYDGYRIEPIQKSISYLMRRPDLPEFDLIYSAGLFDYLPDRLAKTMITCLSGMLSDDGMLSVGNFIPSSHGRGYMEAMMEWKLIYRSEEDMEELGSGLSSDFDKNVFLGGHKNVAYLEIRKS